NRLRDIETDRANLAHGWLPSKWFVSTQPPYGTLMPPSGRRPQHHSRHSRYPGVSGSPQERTFGQARVYEDAPLLAPGSNFFPQQRLQRAAQQPAHRVGDSLPVAGLAVLEFAKTLHQIEKLAVDLNRINRRATMEPLAPTSGISRASLPKGGSF